MKQAYECPELELIVLEKKDVIIFIDSITRLARAYNQVVPPSGRTLSGGLDPAIIEYIAAKEHLTLPEVLNVLNKKSGVQGISGVSSAFRDLEGAAKEGNQRAQEALDVFTYRVAKFVGYYAAAMNGVDVICFTAGIGENDIGVRAQILSYLGFLGCKLDPEANNIRGEERIISTPDSKVIAMVVPTNEELAIARETVAIVG